MTIDEKKLIADTAQRLIEAWPHPIILEMSMSHAVGLIGTVQLALRHPAASRSPTMRQTREMIVALIEHIDPSRGDLYKSLMMGFDPKCDV